MKKFVYIALGLLISIALLLPGCGGSKGGDSAGGKQIVITYTATPTDKLTGYYIQATPKEGNIFMLLDMTIENRSGGPFNIDPLGFFVVAGGTDYPRAFVFELQNAIQLGVVQDNGSLTGKLLFEVPAGTSDFTMKYQGDKPYKIQWVKQ